MSDALIIWALGRSKKLAPLLAVYQALQLAKVTGQAAVNVRGIHADGDIFDLSGTLTKRVGGQAG